MAALHIIEPHADWPRRATLGADKAGACPWAGQRPDPRDTEDFVNELRSMRVTPHVAQNTRNRSSAIDGRTTRHGGYGISQRIRKRIEEAFGWIKTVAGQEKTRFRGVGRFAFTFAAAAYNLVRLPKLIAGGRLMAKVATFAKAFAGRWRIVETDVWANDFLDEVEEAHIPFQLGPDGEIAFGALNGDLDVRYGSRDGTASAKFLLAGLR